MMPNAPIAVVLLSGGLDSAVALAWAQSEGFECRTLCFKYGQRHHAELHAAARVARARGIAPHHHLTLSIDLGLIGGSALTSGLIDVPKQQHSEAPAHKPQRVVSFAEAKTNVPVTYVPARNLIFLSCATALAETLGATDLVAGMNAVDYSGYPDCRGPFIRAFESAANLGTKIGSGNAEHQQAPTWRVHTPLIEMSKPQIIQTGLKLGVDFSLTHSCYDPVQASGDAGDWRACGRCDSCVIRARGFADAGADDPTRYA